MTRTRLVTAVAAAAAGLLAAPAGAAATVSCDLSAGVLDVSIGDSGDVVTLVEDNGAIELGVPGSPSPECTGENPTTANTNAISVHNAPGLTDNVVAILDANEYAPGLTGEPGDDEIEIVVNLNDGARTALVVAVGAPPGSVVWGANGINPNAADREDRPDRDIDHNDTVALLIGNGSSGPDTLSAQGGRGTGGPLTRGFTLFGGEGNDALIGGDRADELFGNDGADIVAGFGGDDLVDGGEGPNGTLSGGAGNDIISPGSVTDPVDGGAGGDLLSYANLQSGVSVDLDGTGAENLDGTGFDDVLGGDDGPNTIFGLEGNDQVDGRGGADTADCGPGADDTVTADPLGLDLLFGCETVVFPPSPDPGRPGGGIGGDAPSGSAPGRGSSPGGGRLAAPPTFGARTLVTIALTSRRMPAAGGRPTPRSGLERKRVRRERDPSGQTTRRPPQRKRRHRLATRQFTVPANAHKRQQAHRQNDAPPSHPDENERPLGGYHGRTRPGSPMTKPRIYTMSFARVYPLYVAKAERKGRSHAEVDEIIRWLTGYSEEALAAQLDAQTDVETFLAQAPRLNPARVLIRGTVCGVRVENLSESPMKEIRYMDKLIDELAKGKAMDTILRVPPQAA